MQKIELYRRKVFEDDCAKILHLIIKFNFSTTAFYEVLSFSADPNYTQQQQQQQQQKKKKKKQQKYLIAAAFSIFIYK